MGRHSGQILGYVEKEKGKKKKKSNLVLTTGRGWAIAVSDGIDRDLFSPLVGPKHGRAAALCFPRHRLPKEKEQHDKVKRAGIYNHVNWVGTLQPGEIFVQGQHQASTTLLSLLIFLFRGKERPKQPSTVRISS